MSKTIQHTLSLWRRNWTREAPKGEAVNAISTRLVGDGTPQFPQQPAEEITQTYDGNGRPCKRTHVSQENIYNEEETLIQVLESNATDHYIYSSVLGAQVVDLVNANGYDGQPKTWVYAGGQRLATAIAGPYGNTTFEHHNPGTGSRVTTNGHSANRAASREERDPQRAPVSLAGGSFSGQNWNQPLIFIGGDPSDYVPGVTLDGMPMRRSDLNRLASKAGSIGMLSFDLYRRRHNEQPYQYWKTIDIWLPDPQGQKSGLPDYAKAVYKGELGRKLTKCINEVFNRLVDAAHSRNGIAAMGNQLLEGQTSRNAPNVVFEDLGPRALGGTHPLDYQRGIVRLSNSNIVDRVDRATGATVSAFEVGQRAYVHELGNYLSSKIVYWDPANSLYGSLDYFGDPNGITGRNGTGPDFDTGAALEKCVFGDVFP